MSYAAGTSVPGDRTRVDIERLLHKHGADSFLYASEGHRVLIGFRLGGRAVRMELPLPPPDSPLFTETPSGRARTATAAREAMEQDHRRRWRSQLLVIKAKLVAVADGISTLEREFMADLVAADGRTVGESLRPMLEQCMGAPLALPPALLLGGGS